MTSATFVALAVSVPLLLLGPVQQKPALAVKRSMFFEQVRTSSSDARYIGYTDLHELGPTDIFFPGGKADQLVFIGNVSADPSVVQVMTCWTKTSSGIRRAWQVPLRAGRPSSKARWTGTLGLYIKRQRWVPKAPLSQQAGRALTQKTPFVRFRYFLLGGGYIGAFVKINGSAVVDPSLEVPAQHYAELRRRGFRIGHMEAEYLKNNGSGKRRRAKNE